MPIIRGGEGVGTRLKLGQHLQIINTHGSQVVDLFAHNAADLEEVMSIQHSRNAWYRMSPRPGDQLWTQLRRPIVTMTEDTSPGVHDTLFPCCDPERYRQLGVVGYHRNCADNWREAIARLGVDTPRQVPSALNLFMNVEIQKDGTFRIVPPVSKPGNSVIFRAEMDCLVVLSACPVDMLPLNGADCRPKDVEFEVLD
jgi:uncharacterized protein YcgI (DUF1989 family)